MEKCSVTVKRRSIHTYKRLKVNFIDRRNGGHGSLSVDYTKLYFYENWAISFASCELFISNNFGPKYFAQRKLTIPKQIVHTAQCSAHTGWVRLSAFHLHLWPAGENSNWDHPHPPHLSCSCVDVIPPTGQPHNQAPACNCHILPCYLVLLEFNLT